MDHIKKVIDKFPERDRKRVKATLRKLYLGEVSTLDIKKLKGREDIFRIRIGNIRVIYQQKGSVIVILTIGRRNDTTYN